jgi:hypothetical protein
MACVGLLMFSAVIGGAGETSGAWINGLYMEESPRPVVTAEAEAWQHANALAQDTSAAFVLVGKGRSMRPLYCPGTILVMTKPPYGDLKRGQTALYLTKDYKVVAHVLVAKVRDGWRVQGLNNSTHDMEPLSPENFVGVVIAAFQPVASGQRVQFVNLR